MNLHLNLNHVRPTAALRRHVAQWVARLEDIADEILAARVVVVERARETEAGRYCVKVHLAVAGPDLHASAEGDSVWASLDGIGHKLAEQLRRRKTRLLKYRRSAPCSEGEQ